MTEAIRDYFNRAFDDFDAIYGRKGWVWRWVNRRLRRDMYERYRLTFETCGDLHGKTVLDIGCGGGRYSVEFAKRGAARVIGIDLAENMTALASQHAQAHGVSDRCFFMVGDFREVELRQSFDICVAIGVFDYVDQPRSFLEKMRSVARERLIMSFPSRSPLRTPLRKIRYRLKRCPVYFYDRRTIEGLMKGLGSCGLSKIQGRGMDYFATVQLNGNATL